jgi:hypothetical protein
MEGGVRRNLCKNDIEFANLNHNRNPQLPAHRFPRSPQFFSKLLPTKKLELQNADACRKCASCSVYGKAPEGYSWQQRASRLSHETEKAVAYQLDYSVNGEKIRTAVGIKNQMRTGSST